MLLAEMIAEVKAKIAAEKAAMKLKLRRYQDYYVPIPAVLVGVFVTQVIIIWNSKK